MSTLSGDLAAWPLTDLIFWLFHSGQTGVVRVRSGSAQGRLQFFEGRLIFAHADEELGGTLEEFALGEGAVNALAQLTSGTFEFLAHTLECTDINVGPCTEDLVLTLPFAMEESSAKVASVVDLRLQRQRRTGPSPIAA